MSDLPRADLAVARKALNAAGAGIARLPAGLAIPMTLTVTNGSLTGVVIKHEDVSLDLVISHPTAGVTVPADATMVTTSMIRSLGGDLVHAESVPPVARFAGSLPAVGSTGSTGSTGSGSSAGVTSTTAGATSTSATSTTATATA